MALSGKKGTKAKDLRGMGIYHDKKNRTVYSAFYMKDGYVIGNDDVLKYSIFSMRFFFMIAAFLFACYFTDNNYLVSALVAVVFIVAAELLFHFWYLASLQKISDFEKPEEEKWTYRMKRQSLIRLLLSSVGLLAISVFIFINIRQRNFSGLNYAANVVIAIIAIIGSIIGFYFVFWKLSHKDETADIDEKTETAKKEEAKEIEVLNKRRAEEMKAAEEARKEREAKRIAKVKAKEAKKKK